MFPQNLGLFHNCWITMWAMTWLTLAQERQWQASNRFILTNEKCGKIKAITYHPSTVASVLFIRILFLTLQGTGSTKRMSLQMSFIFFFCHNVFLINSFNEGKFQRMLVLKSLLQWLHSYHALNELRINETIKEQGQLHTLPWHTM